MPPIVAGSASITSHSVLGERMMPFTRSMRDLPPATGGIEGPSVLQSSPAGPVRNEACSGPNHKRSGKDAKKPAEAGGYGARRAGIRPARTRRAKKPRRGGARGGGRIQRGQRKHLARRFAPLRFAVVAGAGFEPATFRL